MGPVDGLMLLAKVAAGVAVVCQRVLDGLQLPEQIVTRRLEHQHMPAAGQFDSGTVFH